MRLVVARCEVLYTGRLTAFLPESTRLLILKSDGSVLVHADAGGYKPLNWMTPPTTIEVEGEPPELIAVRKRAGKSEDRLEIRIHELLSDVSARDGRGRRSRGRGRAPAPGRAGGGAEALGEGLRLVRREWPTDIGPVDIMCRDRDDGWVAVEVKRVATIEAVEQLCRYLERIRLDPAMSACAASSPPSSSGRRRSRSPRRAGCAASEADLDELEASMNLS